MILTCAWCFAPMYVTEAVCFETLMEGIIPVCSPECQAAHEEMIQNLEAGEDDEHSA